MKIYLRSKQLIPVTFTSITWIDKNNNYLNCYIVIILHYFHYFKYLIFFVLYIIFSLIYTTKKYKEKNKVNYFL